MLRLTMEQEYDNYNYPDMTIDSLLEVIKSKGRVDSTKPQRAYAPKFINHYSHYLDTFPCNKALLLYRFSTVHKLGLVNHYIDTIFNCDSSDYNLEDVSKELINFISIFYKLNYAYNKDVMISMSDCFNSYKLNLYNHCKRLNLKTIDLFKNPNVGILFDETAKGE